MQKSYKESQEEQVLPQVVSGASADPRQQSAPLAPTRCSALRTSQGLLTAAMDPAAESGYVGVCLASTRVQTALGGI